MIRRGLGLLKFRKQFRNRDIEVIQIFSKINNSVLIGKIVKPGNFTSRIDLTENEAILQISAINFNKFQEVKSHKHLPLHRETIGTSEIWLVTKGKFKINLFDIDDSKLGEFILVVGNLVVFFEGGHSLTAMSKNARILEVKNGPYKGADLDKVYI
jgi:hypothetical protein